MQQRVGVFGEKQVGDDQVSVSRKDCLVSVVLATYNGERYLKSAIQSVLDQTHKHFDLIIVVDGSTDKSLEICDEFSGRYSNVKIIYQNNMGLGYSRARGIQESRRDFICFIDDDDMWEPTKLEKQLALFQKLERSNCGTIYTGMRLIDENGNPIPAKRKQRQECGDSGLYWRLFFGNTVGPPSSVMIKRSVLEDVGLPDPTLRHSQDWDLWIRIARKYRIFSIRERLVKYRLHPNQMSRNAKAQFEAAMRLLSKNLALADDQMRKARRLVFENLYYRYLLKYLHRRDLKSSLRMIWYMITKSNGIRRHAS